MNPLSDREKTEATLAEMAVTQVSDKLPSLFDHYVGFELAEVNEDGTKAAGMLGFSIRGVEIYLPVIFLNGRIKGTEVMNLAFNDQYVSATRQWVDYIVSKSHQSMGEPGDMLRGVRGASPSLRIFQTPGYGIGGSKMASFADLAAGEDEGGDLDVPTFLKRAGEGVWRAFAEFALKEPKVAAAMFEFYGPKALHISDFDKDISVSKYASDMIDVAVEKTSTEDVKFVESIDDPKAKALPAKSKGDLAITGIAVIDSRPDKEKSIVLEEKHRVRVTNPSQTGVYEMLTQGALDPVKVIIGVTPFLIEAPSSPAPGCVILNASSTSNTGLWHYNPTGNHADPRRPVVIAESDLGDNDKFEKEVKSRGSKLSSVQVHKTYVLVDPDSRRISMPFTVINRVKSAFQATSDWGKSWIDAANVQNEMFPRATKQPIVHKEEGLRNASDKMPTTVPDSVWVELSGAETGRIFLDGDRLMVPENARVIEVVDNNICCVNPSATYEENSIIPAVAEEVSSAIRLADGSIKKAGLVERLAIGKEGGGDLKVSWRGKTLSLKTASAIKVLVGRVGLSDLQARDLVARANEYESIFEAVASGKTAAAIDIPWPETDILVGETTYSGTPEVGPQQYSMRGDFDGYVDPSQDQFDPDIANYSAIQRSIAGGSGDIISRAAESGIKQVFDMSIVSSLMRGGRIETQMEEDYLPAISKGLDRASRVLLRFYWSNSEFSEVYGSEDIAEFEDILLSLIKTTGKVVLFLTQKAGSAQVNKSDVGALSEISG